MRTRMQSLLRGIDMEAVSCTRASLQCAKRYAEAKQSLLWLWNPEPKTQHTQDALESSEHYADEERCIYTKYL